jgi:hypothetical protein
LCSASQRGACGFAILRATETRRCALMLLLPGWLLVWSPHGPLWCRSWPDMTSATTRWWRACMWSRAMWRGWPRRCTTFRPRIGGNAAPVRAPVHGAPWPEDGSLRVERFTEALQRLQPVRSACAGGARVFHLSAGRQAIRQDVLPRPGRTALRLTGAVASAKPQSVKPRKCPLRQRQFRKTPFESGLQASSGTAE